MTYYAPWLVTLDYVRLHRGLPSTETSGDELLRGFITDCSAEFIAGLQGRIPMPYVDTRSFGADNVSGLDLKLRDDLLAVTSITDGDGAVVSASAYNLRPDNLYPKHTVELKSSSGAYWNITYREDRVQVAGVWGYAPHYANGAWLDSTVDVPVGDMSASSTTLTLASEALAQGFEVGQYLRVGSEVIQLSSRAAAVWTHTRAELGTTAAEHLAGVSLETYQQLPDIRAAVREMVAYRYLHKDMIGSRVTVIANGVVTVEDLDPSVEKALKRHQRKLLPLAV